jgi:hypothetical protein
MRPNVAVFKRDLVGTAWLPPVAATTLIKAIPLHQEFRQAGDGFCDAPGFIGCQVIASERPFLQVVAAMDGNDPEATGIPDVEPISTCLFDAPRGRKSSFWVA